MSSRPVYRCVLRWRHLVNAYGVMVGVLIGSLVTYHRGSLFARAKPYSWIGLRAMVYSDVLLVNCCTSQRFVFE